MILVLFDIDCTLMRTGGAGMAAMSQALARVWEGAPEQSQVAPCGQTDPKIIRAMLHEAGLPSQHWPELEKQILDIYPPLLQAELQARRDQARLEAGVEELVQKLHLHPHICLGVLTGNLESTARMKLDLFGLNDFFPIGAFGSDCADRNSLGPIALERARGHYACDFSEVWFVGDTHHDIAAARSCGARVLAVATGSFSRAHLEEFSPDHCLDDLTETEVLSLLLGAKR